jgi:hypothetical protein
VDKSKTKIKFALTQVKADFTRVHINRDDAMHAISLEYTDLSSAALIKIFQLADLLEVTPKQAAKIYLTAKATKATTTKAA